MDAEDESNLTLNELAQKHGKTGFGDETLLKLILPDEGASHAYRFESANRNQNHFSTWKKKNG